MIFWKSFFVSYIAGLEKHRPNTGFSARMLSRKLPPGGYMVKQLVERLFDCSLLIKMNIVFKQVITFHYETETEWNDFSFTFADNFIQAKNFMS